MAIAAIAAASRVFFISLSPDLRRRCATRSCQTAINDPGIGQIPGSDPEQFMQHRHLCLQIAGIEALDDAAVLH
ncbi:hypothetical protein, partial [Cupriavidus sp. a3]|uniref:hypothetical protein n=1 Tax=Cupriavidus sp. a3 TaxID=3242158 RepID=UPI003D9C1D35